MRLLPFALLLFGCAAPILPVDDAEPPTSTHDVGEGRDLFLHSWVENDARSVDGNGLGPVFNARSCVACHAQGGVGGAGGRHMNVEASVAPAHQRDLLGGLGLGDPNLSKFGGLGGLGLGGLGSGRGSIGLGTGGLRPAKFGGTASHFNRNTPALFGAGLIDAIPDEVIEAQATLVLADPDVLGRVGRDEEGRVTRFGWKGEVAHLHDFVTQACALEMGLTVPGRAELPGPDDEESPGLDVDAAGVDALTAFVSMLPAPIERGGHDDGRARFEEIGCTACHVENLGPASGVYSDLLLHDMGPRLASGGSFYGAPVTEHARLWRTPPLWGVRDSGPWMHDGRADSLARAIRMHGGESAGVLKKYLALDDAAQDSVVRFLETLVAPGLGDV